MAPDELAAWSEADAGSIGHGGEWETSLQLYLRPELVAMALAVKDEWRLKFSPEVGRYARFPERRREMAHGVMGDPFVASAAKGERLFAVLLERLVALCREYHLVDPPKYREFGSHCP
jgi:creatinine amidohydrolase